jgi:uncharacterized protein YndB with AHSA1/START domain
MRYYEIMKQIEQTYAIKAPIERVWWALTTAEGAEGWGAGPAKFNASEGGEFSYWDGDIHGVNTKVVPEKLLEQDWYGHDNPSWKYTTSFTFEADGGGTTLVRLVFAGNILDERKEVKDLQDYYFDPIKKLLEENEQ